MNIVKIGDMAKDFILDDQDGNCCYPISQLPDIEEIIKVLEELKPK